MTTKTWNFTLEGKPHTLILEHKWLSGKRSVILDGQLLESIPPSLFASGSVHEYEVDGHSLVAVIQEKPASFAYDLLVDGVSLDTGERGPQRVGNTSLQGAIALAVMIFFIGLGISIWQCARKGCQAARGKRERAETSLCQLPLIQAVRALAVKTAPSTFH